MEELSECAVERGRARKMTAMMDVGEGYGGWGGMILPSRDSMVMYSRLDFT